MAIDTSQPLSPGWWLKRLTTKLLGQRQRFDNLEDYYEGDAPLQHLNPSKAVRDAYRRLMALSRTNFAELVVEAVRERMTVTGFRTGAVSDDLGDSDAWRIWQANQLDADAGMAHRAMLTMSQAAVIVGGVDPEIGAPLITIEDPRTIAVEVDPARKRRTLAAVKLTVDEVNGVVRAYLYLPGYVVQAVRKLDSIAKDSHDLLEFGDWNWLPDTFGQLPVPVVPVVRFVNRPELDGDGKGEFEPHLSVLDRINYTILSRLEIATLQAFRQRGIKGLPDRDAAGNEIDYADVFSADPGALWQLPDTAEIWESGSVDLGPIRDAIRHDVQDLAATTRTPLFYLTPDAANGSAEGASLAREGLVFKTQDRLVQTGEGWEQVMALAFAFAGDTVRANRRDMEIIWASPERFSLAERYDAATKAQAAGVPWRTVMSSILQYTPQEIARMEAERTSDALLLASLATPVMQVTPTPPANAPVG